MGSATLASASAAMPVPWAGSVYAGTDDGAACSVFGPDRGSVRGAGGTISRISRRTKAAACA